MFERLKNLSCKIIWCSRAVGCAECSEAHHLQVMRLLTSAHPTVLKCSVRSIHER